MAEIDELIMEINPRYSEEGKPAPVWENAITYDTSMGTLEPLYFWIIDFIQGAGYKLEKLIDNFTAAPGSSYFADLGVRATKMQEEGIKIMGMVNQIVKSVINLIYDLRNFELRFRQYDDAKSEDAKVKEAGILGLKEIWMNSVDAQRGMGSINNMAHQYGFTLLRPAFMAAKSVQNIDEMDLNEVVKRVLKPRVAEFFDWAELSEKELRKRYEIQKSYLRNQIDTLKLYSSWVKPYLTAAEQLRMKEMKAPALVSVFGSMILELSLLAKKKINVVEAAKSKDLPERFAKIADKIREFWQVVVVDFTFRTYPTQAAPHAGRVDMGFKAYALNDDEMLLFEKLREERAVGGVLNIAEAAAGESLEQLKEDIDHFLKPKEEEKKEEWLFGGLFKEVKKSFVGMTRAEKEKEAKEKKKKEEEEKEKKKRKLAEEGVPEDSYEESIVREYTEINAAEYCFKVFDVFKKSQGMASFPSPFDQPDVIQRLRQRRAEIAAAMKK